MLGAKDILIELKGDNKDFKKSLSGADSSMGSFTNSMKKYGPAIAASLAIGTAAIVGMSVKMAAAEEVVNRQTESILKSQGIMWSEVGDEVTDYINKLEELTAYGDTDLQMAFNRMSASGLSYKQTMESMNMVTDIAYTRGIDLVAAADLVSKAYNGQASSLKRYGIIVEAGVTGAEALAAVQTEVNNNFADASDRTETLEGKMERLNEATDDFQEALGAELLDPLSEFVGLLGDGGAEAESFATKLGDIIARPIEGMSAGMLAKEFRELDSIQQKTWKDKQRMSEIAFRLEQDGFELLEKVNGQYVFRTEVTHDIVKIDEDILAVEESIYFTQLKKMGATQEYINFLKDQLDIEKGITVEGEKQLSLAERRKAFDARAATRSGFSRVSSSTMSGLRDTAAAYEAGGSYTRQSGGHTITYSGDKSGV